MRKICLFIMLLVAVQNTHSQEDKDQEEVFTFPSEYGDFTLPLWSKVVLELKETENEKYVYRILNLESYDKFYSFKESPNLFEKNPKENTVELYFIGAFYNDGENDKDYKTILKIRNNLKKDITYKADIKYYYKDDFENTSIVGAYSGVSTTEIWHNKIDFIALYDFKVNKL